MRESLLNKANLRYDYDSKRCNRTMLNCLNDSVQLVDCDKGFIYDDSLFTQTIVTQVFRN